MQELHAYIYKMSYFIQSRAELKNSLGVKRDITKENGATHM